MSERLQNAVAIIGMAGHFPGAENVEQFWQNLCAGQEAIRRIPELELEDRLSAGERAQENYVAARALLENVDLFDAEFFRFLPREAELTDPQQRVLIECAWEAFEDAGYDPATVKGNTGVFAGSSINTYLLLNLASDAKFREEFTRSYQVGSFPALVGNGQDFLATRISYKLNLRGPAMTVQSACSTSLLAVAQAWQSLVNYQSDLALAGAVSISFPQRRGYFYNEGGMVSPDGHCRPFDAAAAGTVFGAGAGMVLLKRAEEAIADGDHIYAMLLGAGINNDGADKIGYAAPSSKGQADAIAMAHAVAGVDAASIGYVECHGTGTPLGDPIEVSALVQVFASEQPRAAKCLLSSVKGNVGHLDVAAGMAGLMKAALSLERGKVPGTLHYSAPNPRLNLEETPFAIAGVVTEWPRGQADGDVRRAGVSAFGVGGTNVHLVLEEAPEAATGTSERAKQVLCLSGRSEAALDAQCMRLAKYFESAETVSLPDVAYTLAVGRRAFSHRLTVVVDSRDAALVQLRKPNEIRGRRVISETKSRVAMLFPGQGSQYPGMGEGLYRGEPSYRQIVDDCCDRLQGIARFDLRKVLYSESSEAADLLAQTRYAQPALFVTSYALARLWMQWGVAPACLVGHSVGELVAACVAGVFSLDDALHFVAQRGEWMQEMPPGTMLAVRMQLSQLQMLLPSGIAIAAMNSPSLAVVSGRTEEIEKFAVELQRDKVACTRLNTSHAFHSSMMEPVVERLQGLLGGMQLHAPQMKIVSTVTGEALTDAQATSPEYWARQCRVPVNFSAAAATLVGEGYEVVLEVGAGETLATLVRQHLARGSRTGVYTSIPSLATGQQRDWERMGATAGALWAHGVVVDWNAFYASESRRRVALPTYPFERKRFWIEATYGTDVQPGAPTPGSNTLNGNTDTPPQSGMQSSTTWNALEKTMTSENLEMTRPASSAGEDRAARFRREIALLLEDLSGLELAPDQHDASFLELGFDSLFLTQAAQKLNANYGVKIAFRHLLDDLSSIALVAEYLDAHVTPDVSAAAHAAAPAVSGMTVPGAGTADDSPSATMMRQQLQAMSELIQTQLQMLNATGAAIAGSAAPVQGVVEVASDKTAQRKPVSHGQAAMTAEQKTFLARLIERYCGKTAKSKAFTQAHRRTLADPRVASGFRPEWKEMVYSIVSARSAGSKLWDIDGNEYVDLLNGFGPTMFGHSPHFVAKAIEEQLKEGFAIGPQTPLAGRAAELLTEMTGAERVTFCNTGSEAVMAAMRIARTVTGRDRVVFFSGDYHGQFDEVLAKQLKRKGEFSAQPAAPGIPRANLGNITVLDYGTDEALAYIEQHANELAAVLIEPVQSRHPHLQPKEFLTHVREITRRSGTAFIFDEVVTGFRIHPRGAQGFYGIDADLVTYGKVIGGGMPIGILAGKAAFMDALDGGYWEFGDDSVPEAGVTFFAGTFVRHPLTMAALCATLEHVRNAGDALYERLNRRASQFASELSAVLAGTPMHVENCGSVFYLSVPSDLRFGGLLFYLLREKGVFLLEGFPMYLTTAHTDADLERVVRAFRESVAELQECDLLPQSKVDGIATATVTEFPLTQPQMEILLAAQVSDEANCAFNESFRLTLEGRLDRNALESAWTSVLGRHDALRMFLTPPRDRMRLDRNRVIAMEAVDLAGHPAEKQQALLDKVIADEGTQQFDLVQGPLLRAKLVTLALETHVLVVTAHHLICDGWSVNVMVEELGQLYSAALKGAAAALPPTMAFSEYASHVQTTDWRNQEANDLAYWKQQLAPLPELPTLPADRSRPSVRSFAGATLVAEWPKDFAVALRKTGAGAGCTLFTTLLAGWQILLWRLTGNADPVTMIPAAAQSQIADKVLVGHCVHLLPLRRTLNAEQTASDTLRALKPVVLDAYEHQTATYGSIIRALGMGREPGRLPLSEVQFNLEQVGQGAGFDGLKTEVHANGKRAVNFDLFLNIVDTGNGLRLECDYSTALYNEATVAGWMACYRTLLEGMIANPAQSIATLPILESAVRGQLAATNDTATGPMAAENVAALVAQAFAAMPSQPAADFYGLTLSRSELTQKSDRLAAWLLRHGAGPGMLVGIYMDRSLEMLVAMLGVMKAGAAYVPLDPMFPAARIAQILEETKVPVMLTLGAHLEMLPKSNARVLALDAKADMLEREPKVELPRIAADARAYVIFTSGSTGRPKGVEVTHGSVVNLLTDLSQRLEMKPSDRLLAVTTLSFDISVLEMLLPLVSGGTVAIAHGDDVVDGTRLLELLQATQATVLQATPVTWRMLIEQNFQPRHGFKMLCGGEAWTPAIADQLLGTDGSSGRMWNMYGPTETTVWSSVTEVKRGAARMTIGPPIANTRFYVLDTRLQVVPPGVAGELFIAGAGVARGYFNRPELNAEKFLTDPFYSEERMYRTGDEVRQLPDGRVEFMGRLDQQIKLRGFRIELGEIETAMRAQPGIRDAVVVLRPDANEESVLVGYYTGAAASTAAEWREALRAVLPAYMIPTTFLHLEQLPLTPNGKLDRRALPDGRSKQEERDKEFTGPRTSTEILLAEIFCDVLGCKRISIHTSLLDQGADSLRMFQIASRAQRRGLAVTARQLMQLHTVEAVAAVLDSAPEAVGAALSSATPLQRVSRESYRLSR
jgi:amino acid adenylation domain-containing protein